MESPESKTTGDFGGERPSDLDRQRLYAGGDPRQTHFFFYVQPDPPDGARDPGRKQPSLRRSQRRGGEGSELNPSRPLARLSQLATPRPQTFVEGAART